MLISFRASCSLSFLCSIAGSSIADAAAINRFPANARPRKRPVVASVSEDLVASYLKSSVDKPPLAKQQLDDDDGEEPNAAAALAPEPCGDDRWPWDSARRFGAM
jgi:hypothetical protein